MLTLEVVQKRDRTGLLKQVPQEEHCSNLVTEPFRLMVDGAVRAIYLPNQPIQEMYHAVRKLDKKAFGATSRMSGIAGGFSRTFGFAPRDPVRQHNFCTRARLHREYPSVANTLLAYAEHLGKIYRALLPEGYDSQRALVEKAVREHWRMPNSPFTSGIVNWNNPLQYHYDAGNFEGTWSVMAVFKKDVDGGHLILPDYDVKVELGHCSLFLFDGQADIHGVTPILKRHWDAHRYSVVYYALEKMCVCTTPAEEVRYAQKSRTDTELKRFRADKEKREKGRIE